MPSVGFGFEEVGSITGEPCKGNSKPRLWRLPELESLKVNYGLKNNGCEEIAKRLEKEFCTADKSAHYNENGIIPLGINIAKTNSPETDDIERGIADYLKAYKTFADIGDYFTINISCPNTAGGEPFLKAENLDRLLTVLDANKTSKPIFIKLSPDLSHEEIDELLNIIARHNVQGIICSNLTRKINGNGNQKGGLSGKVVENLANDLISYVYKKTKGKYIIIGCGGIFSAEDAYKKIRLGASLVQLITGMIYEARSSLAK